mmetsp:Transcript_22454/g.72707  ORF Transcript_22454/g.72707 Transcript_22454/m.72707 type:complete len:312 (-) Transcript_22454:271-1206(-)
MLSSATYPRAHLETTPWTEGVAVVASTISNRPRSSEPRRHSTSVNNRSAAPTKSSSSTLSDFQCNNNWATRSLPPLCHNPHKIECAATELICELWHMINGTRWPRTRFVSKGRGAKDKDHTNLDEWCNSDKWPLRAGSTPMATTTEAPNALVLPSAHATSDGACASKSAHRLAHCSHAPCSAGWLLDSTTVGAHAAHMRPRGSKTATSGAPSAATAPDIRSLRISVVPKAHAALLGSCCESSLDLRKRAIQAESIASTPVCNNFEGAHLAFDGCCVQWPHGRNIGVTESGSVGNSPWSNNVPSAHAMLERP